VKINKIVESREFSDLFKNGKKVQGDVLSVHYKTNNETKEMYLGVSVSKKMAPLAVDRNYVKRRIMAFFRDEAEQKEAGYKIVVRVTGEIKEQKAKKMSLKIKEELDSLLKKMK